MNRLQKLEAIAASRNPSTQPPLSLSNELIESLTRTLLEYPDALRSVRNLQKETLNYIGRIQFTDPPLADFDCDRKHYLASALFRVSDAAMKENALPIDSVAGDFLFALLDSLATDHGFLSGVAIDVSQYAYKPNNEALFRVVNHILKLTSQFEPEEAKTVLVFLFKYECCGNKELELNCALPLLEEEPEIKFKDSTLDELQSWIAVRSYLEPLMATYASMKAT